MIRINLLPVRAAKKKESIRFQLTVAGLITFLVVAVCMGVYIKLRSDVSVLRSDIAGANQELAQLKLKLGELTKVETEKQIVQSKLDVVKRLESARSGPVDLLTRIAGAIPEKAWLQTIDDSGNIITITGYAASEEVYAEFMRGLQSYEDFRRVELKVAKSEELQEVGREFVQFTFKLERK